MKKRLFSLDLAVAMAASLTAFGDSKIVETTTAAPAAKSSAVGETTATGEAAEITGATGDVIKTGGIGPTTGGATAYGLTIQRDVQLVVDEVNATGEVNGTQVEFKFEDDEHDAEKSINAYNTLEDWGVQALMGTVTSVPCIAVADKATSDNMFQITPSGSIIGCATNPSVFRICFSNPDQGAASAKYIGENKLASKIAVIYGSSGVYSDGIYEKFVGESKNQDLEIVIAEAFTANSNRGFSAQLRKAKDVGTELMFLPIYYVEASLILQQANKTGFAPQFFGCDGMDGILQVQNFDTKPARGLTLLTPFATDASDDLIVNFVRSYKDAYNEVPVRFAADAYDAIYAIKAAVEDADVASDMDASAVCDAPKTSMLNIKLDGLTDEGVTWTEGDGPHKASRAVKVMDGAYTAM